MVFSPAQMGEHIAFVTENDAEFTRTTKPCPSADALRREPNALTVVIGTVMYAAIQLRPHSLKSKRVDCRSRRKFESAASPGCYEEAMETVVTILGAILTLAKSFEAVCNGISKLWPPK